MKKRKRSGAGVHGSHLLDTVTDPFDRILIAQAIAEGLPLVTDDQPIRGYPVRTIW